MADTIPAMLEPGEYVLNRNAAMAIGKEKLDELNYEEAPRRGYRYGGSILGSLLSRTQKKDEGPVYPKHEFTIPAGKNIFGQSTEEMGMEELLEMIMPGGGPMGAVKKGAGVLKEGVGAMKYGKAGIEKFMAKPTRREGLEAMGKFMTTGKGQKEILENARLEVLLEELKKWATHKGLFEKVVQRQQGGEVPETLLSMISGGKYGTSKDLPSIREQIIPALELLTGAEHVPEGQSAGLTDLALAIPFLGKLGKGAKAAKAAKPAMSKYYASIFGGKKVNEAKAKKYLEKMFSEETIGMPGSAAHRAQKVWKESKTPPFGLRQVDAPGKVLAKHIAGSLKRRGRGYELEKGMSEKEMWDEHISDLPSLIRWDASKVRRGVESFIKEAQGAHKKYYGKQRGGSIDDYSLMDYMMPAMDKRLGPSLKKFQFGGYATDYQGNVVGPQTTGSGGYTSPSQYQYGATPPATGTPSTGTGGLPTSPTGFGGGMTGTGQSTLGTALATASEYTPPPSAQSLLTQSSGSMSTGIESIFQEAGYETPGADYLEGLQAYDPTKQQRLQEDYSRKLSGPVGGAGGFAGSGAATREAGKQRELVTGQYQRGAEDLRKQYREDTLAQIKEDVLNEIYEFEDLA